MADKQNGNRVPADFDVLSDSVWPLVKNTPGYLSEREARFLMLAAACSPGSGGIVEIGSFKGRSTVAIASVAKHYGLGPVIAVDPHTAPSVTDPKLQQATSYDDFIANLTRAGVVDVVQPKRMYSRDLAPALDAPIRFLWIDGDHTVSGAREDVRLFRPFLEPGGILAMHDVLGTWEGSLRVFCEDVLDSDDFGPAGFCGSIGWAQYLPNAGRRYRLRRRLLAYPAKKLMRVAQTGRGLVGFHKYWYKFWRPLAPHGDADPQRWARAVGSAITR